MPGMSGIELIKWVWEFLASNDVPISEFPQFAFRSEQFYSLQPEQIAEINSMKIVDVIEKISDVKMIEKYFKKINYRYKLHA